MKNLENIFILKEFFEDDPDPDLDVDDPDEKDKKNTDVDVDGLKKDRDAAIARRTAALKRAQKAEAENKALKEKMGTLPDEEEFASLKEDYEKMQKQLKDLDEERKAAELDKIEDEKERERIKLQREFEKEREKWQSELDKLKGEISTFSEEKEKLAKVAERQRKRALQGSILSAAAVRAFNPQQIVRLIEHEFVYDEKDDTYYKQVYNKDGKLTELISIEEYVETFLNDPVNENLLKADIRSGSDTPRGNRADRDAASVAGEEPTAEMYSWAEDVGLGINKKASAEEKAWLIDRFNRLHKRVKQE